MAPPARSENHTPSQSPTMSAGPLFEVGIRYSVICPVALIRPILLAVDSRKYTKSSLPITAEVIDVGPLSGVGMGYSVIVPLASIRPILFARYSVNQTSVVPKATPGPVVMPSGPEANVGIGNSWIGVAARMSRRPMRFPSYSVNQVTVEWTIPRGLLAGVGMSYSVTSPSGFINPIRLVPTRVKARLPWALRPRAIASGRLPAARRSSEIEPSGRIKASESALGSANQISPSPVPLN